MRNCRNPEPIPDRPGYRAYRTEGGRVIYMEDEIMENMIGRRKMQLNFTRWRQSHTTEIMHGQRKETLCR